MSNLYVGDKLVFSRQYHNVWHTESSLMRYRKLGYKLVADGQDITSLPVSEVNSILRKAKTYDVYAPEGTHFPFMDDNRKQKYVIRGDVNYTDTQESTEQQVTDKVQTPPQTSPQLPANDAPKQEIVINRGSKRKKKPMFNL